MSFKDLFNKAVSEAQKILEKPETQEFISKVKQGATELKQKAEVFVEESDEKLKKIIEEKFLKKTEESESKDNDFSDTKEEVKKEESPIQNQVIDKEIPVVSEPTPSEKVVDIHISQLGFKFALEKTLAEAGFDTKNKIKAATDEQLTSLVGIGKATLKTIREKTAE